MEQSHLPCSSTGSVDNCCKHNEHVRNRRDKHAWMNMFETGGTNMLETGGTNGNVRPRCTRIRPEPVRKRNPSALHTANAVVSVTFAS
ncbi:hypothetical protein V6N12_041914 [Hibiscus sabdariffa]|uniref:Uncharacterized protein n=1 Tax=Hibiscus sabdariffa TaxID=183260 RepID=A0ABR2EEZ2_9ROSI